MKRPLSRGVGVFAVACSALLLASLLFSPALRERARWYLALARIVIQVNVDESDVPEYSLPDPLVDGSGRRIGLVELWPRRRDEILELFRSQVYGRSPGPPPSISFDTVSVEGAALDGLATRAEVVVRVHADPDAPRMHLLLYSPKDAPAPVPVFLGLNFWGNHAVDPDPAIRLSMRWMPDDPEHGIEHNRATDLSRGSSSSRWPIEALLRRGYGVATAYYGDLEPDGPDGLAQSIRRFYGGEHDPSEWGAIAVWAWSLSRALDYLEGDPGFDARRVIVFGHSRLGKVALWAAARDERFAMAISNESGCLGAALSRRRFGETIAFIEQLFPHWFPAALSRYPGDEDALPVDQHMLLALVAPRPLYVASAEEDVWADPRGEFLAALGADPVYRLLGTDGLPAAAMPPAGEPVMGRIGYHLRPGEHDITAWDWDRFLDFADLHLGVR